MVNKVPQKIQKQNQEDMNFNEKIEKKRGHKKVIKKY